LENSTCRLHVIDSHGKADVSVGLAMQQPMERTFRIHEPGQADNVPAGRKLLGAIIVL
jgi:hypothetical protein